MKAIALSASAAFLLLAGCENPADKTADAQVADPKKKAATDTAGGAKYVFTENSKIGFTGSKVTGSHSGGFKTFTGHFTIKDGEPVGNDHHVEIDMRSTWADNPRLEGHLKNADFFDVDKFHKTTFDVTEIKKTGEDSYSVTGNLNFHGVEKSVTFPATVTKDGDLARIQAEFDINRFDFGIQYPGKPDDLIRKEVIIKLDLEATPE